MRFEISLLLYIDDRSQTHMAQFWPLAGAMTAVEHYAKFQLKWLSDPSHGGGGGGGMPFAFVVATFNWTSLSASCFRFFSSSSISFAH